MFFSVALNFYLVVRKCFELSEGCAWLFRKPFRLLTSSRFFKFNCVWLSWGCSSCKRCFFDSGSFCRRIKFNCFYSVSDCIKLLGVVSTRFQLFFVLSDVLRCLLLFDVSQFVYLVLGCDGSLKVVCCFVVSHYCHCSR